jgi:hypothetical protein
LENPSYVSGMLFDILFIEEIREVREMRGLTGLKTETRGKNLELVLLVVAFSLLQILFYVIGDFTRSEVLKRILLSISGVGVIVSLLFPLAYLVLRNRKNKK